MKPLTIAISAYVGPAVVTFGHAYNHYAETWQSEIMNGAFERAIVALAAGTFWPLYWMTWIFLMKTRAYEQGRRESKESRQPKLQVVK